MRTHVAFVLSASAILLLTESSCGKRTGETARTIGQNFLDEVGDQSVVVQALRDALGRDEHLGFAGSDGMGLSTLVSDSHSRLEERLAAVPGLTVIPTSDVQTDSMYRRMAANKEGDSTELVKKLALFIRRAEPAGNAERAGISGPERLAVVTYVGYNGVRGLVYGKPLLTLLDPTAEQMAVLARSLGADGLISVALAPDVTKFLPFSESGGGELGQVWIQYRITVHDSRGKLVVDRAYFGDPEQPGQFIAFRLSFFQRLRMGMSQVFFLFPRDAQKEELANAERSIMAGVFREIPAKLTKDIIR